MMRCISLCILLLGCGHNASQPAEPDVRLETLRDLFTTNMAEAESLKSADGWLTPTDGDGMLWSGKAAAAGLTGFNPSAAEVEPGRFVRCPTAQHCQTSDNELWSDWSRDMFAGVTAYAWRAKDRAVLERHLAYGKAHHWIMGTPFGDGRSTYLPATYGRLYQTLYGLGGTDDPKRLWPDVYPSGLTDYKAHMQMMNIWLRAEIGEGSSGDARPAGTQDDVGSPQANLTAVDDTQLDRIKEHAARDPRDPFFQCLNGIYSGDLGPAITAALADDQYAGEYVRCDEYRRCQLAAWLFAADCILRRY